MKRIGNTFVVIVMFIAASLTWNAYRAASTETTAAKAIRAEGITIGKR